MSSHFKFSVGWFMFFTILHAAGTFYLCFVTALFSPENHFAWYWNPLAMKILQFGGVTNIATPAILGLLVSGLIGTFFGYLMPIFSRRTLVAEPRATGNPDRAGSYWDTNSSDPSDESNIK